MKAFLSIILFFSLLIGCNSASTDGFTGKGEAKNQMVNGLKEGKWKEFLDSNFNVSSDSNSLYYAFSNYSKGKIEGVRYIYRKTGELRNEIPYVKGIENGISRGYYKTGKLFLEIPFIDGKMNGLGKVYYESGSIQIEEPYYNDKLNGVLKEYYENGKLKQETRFDSGKIKGIIGDYDRNGNEIK